MRERVPGIGLALGLLLFAGLVTLAIPRFGAPEPSHTRVIPWVAASPGFDPNRLTRPPELLSPAAAAVAVKSTVAGANPLLLPAAIPAGFDARFIGDRSRFTVTYVSSAAGQRIDFSLELPRAPLLGPRAITSERSFRRVRAQYGVDEPSDPHGYRSLMWVEPGSWSGGAPALNGLPYFLRTTGIAEAEFWRVADSIDTISWPPGPPACLASAMRAAGRGRNGAGGHLMQSLVFVNHGASACTLMGYPKLTLLTAAGALDLAQHDGNFFVGAPPSPVTLEPEALDPSAIAFPRPGQTAYVVFEWDFCPGPDPKVRGVSVDLPAGGRVIVATAASPSRCDEPSQQFAIGVGPFQSPPRTDTTPAPRPFAVQIVAPSSVKAGSTLQYQVRVTNVSGAPYHFEGCPAYTEVMDSVPQKLVRGMYRLNCAPVGTLGAGAIATFAMVLDIPATTPAGAQQLTWRVGPFLDQGQATTPITVVAG